MIWYGMFFKSVDFITCPLVFTVKAVYQGVLRIVVCQEVQTTSTACMVKTRGPVVATHYHTRQAYITLPWVDFPWSVSPQLE